MKIEIKDDVFDIVSRLKQIDSDYFVLYNLDCGRFELHCKNQAHTSYCLSFEDRLDYRAIEKTLKTRKQNKDKLFEELKGENKWM